MQRTPATAPAAYCRTRRSARPVSALQLSPSDGAPAAVDASALVFHRDKSTEAHVDGCYGYGAAFVWEDGATAPVRSKASNRCPGCARAVAYENMTMLRQDAEENSAPGHVLTLTSRDPVTSPGAYRTACYLFWRAFRKRWGHVEYCGFIEWTTGDGPRSGGFRRMHSHWLVKGLKAEGLELVEQWVRVEWAKLTGAWIVQLAALETVGGVVGYLALHHEKQSQAPPEGWTGRRLRPSKGYFAIDGRTRRDRAKLWLADHRANRDELDEGARLNLAARKAPKLIFGRSENERAIRDLTAGAPPAGYFDSLPARRALDLQLCRAAAVRADEALADYYARRYREMLRERALRSRAQRALNRAGGRIGVGDPSAR